VHFTMWALFSNSNSWYN